MGDINILSLDVPLNDVHARYGRTIMTNFIDQHTTPTHLPGPRVPSLVSNRTQLQEPVGILGAGIPTLNPNTGPAGLYSAMILEDLGIPYRVLEAQNRVGGRLYTHRFNDSEFGYYDVGAMRFPQTKAMGRLFHLFNYPSLDIKSKLQKYYFSPRDNNGIMYYNSIRLRKNAVEPSSDPFKAKEVIKDVADPTPYISVGPDAIMKDVIGPYAKALFDDFKSGFEALMKIDMYSTRAFMSIKYRPSEELKKRGLPDTALSNDVVNWCETFTDSTGAFDRAFSETILHAISFGWNPDGDAVDWYCIRGGAEEIANAMKRYIDKQKPNAITLNQRVKSIKYKSLPGNQYVEVETNNNETHQFPHVISTLPLTVLRFTDLNDAGLSLMQSKALRMLDYGPSVKIGMLFKTAWWTTAKDLDGNLLNIVGGQSTTDRPLRMVVYPSFGDVEEGKTTTLIASYSWTADANRIGGFVANPQKVVEEFVLKELAVIHNVSAEFLRDQLVESYPWDWSRDPNMLGGAFAFFGPGRFQNVYTSMNVPAAGGHLHFASEALSVRHGWIEGALASAWNAVHSLLLQPPFCEQPGYLEKFFKNWGVCPEWFEENAFHETHGHTPSSYIERLKRHDLLAKIAVL